MCKGNHFKVHPKNSTDHSSRCQKQVTIAITFITSFILRLTLLMIKVLQTHHHITIVFCKVVGLNEYDRKHP